jgi:hypothetical protein
VYLPASPKSSLSSASFQFAICRLPYFGLHPVPTSSPYKSVFIVSQCLNSSPAPFFLANSCDICVIRGGFQCPERASLSLREVLGAPCSPPTPEWSRLCLARTKWEHPFLKPVRNQSKPHQNECATASKIAKIVKNRSKLLNFALPILPHPRFVRALIVKVCLSCQNRPRKIRTYIARTNVK